VRGSRSLHDVELGDGTTHNGVCGTGRRGDVGLLGLLTTGSVGQHAKQHILFNKARDRLLESKLLFCETAAASHPVLRMEMRCPK